MVLKNFNRRDFLKLISLLPFTYFLPSQSQNSYNIDNDSNQKNILIIVFDALSASNMPVYGYRRNTTPKLLKILDQATVYHNHFASANFTTPGTASLLTGAHSWTHRAIKINQKVIKSLESRNIFNAFSNHHRFAYTHNYNVDKLLNQFQNDIDDKENMWNLFLSKDRVISNWFTKDYDVVSLVDSVVFDTSRGSNYSLLLSRFVKDFLEKKSRQINKDYLELFPRRLPSFKNYSLQFFILEDAIDWLKNSVERLPQPYLGYIHLLPPHSPYRTRREFIDIFNDDWTPPAKPPLFKPIRGYSEETANENRRLYDEFVAYVDEEFYRLFIFLQQSGVLENTIVVFTSDHGEMFERGIIYHSTASMHQPVVHIPLIIFHPEQKKRIDITSPTSAIDVLPTLLHASGQSIPTWCEGEVLPPFRNTSDEPDRSILSLVARYNPDSLSPLTKATGMIVKGNYKLTYYYGYDELPNNEPIIELYNLKNDPEELENLYSEKKSLANNLINELVNRIEEADEPYKH